jgi:hypothetical protein
MIRAHQPGSQPIDIPEVIPNPAVVPKQEPAPKEPAPKKPVKVPEKIPAGCDPALRGRRQMSKLMVWFGLLAASLMLPTMAQAQMAPNRGTPEDQKACSGDARRHCRAVLEQGDMAVLACLQQQRRKLTRACRAVLRKHGH